MNAVIIFYLNTNFSSILYYSFTHDKIVRFRFYFLIHIMNTQEINEYLQNGKLLYTFSLYNIILL